MPDFLTTAAPQDVLGSVGGVSRSPSAAMNKVQAQYRKQLKKLLKDGNINKLIVQANTEIIPEVVPLLQSIIRNKDHIKTGTLMGSITTPKVGKRIKSGKEGEKASPGMQFEIRAYSTPSGRKGGRTDQKRKRKKKRVINVRPRKRKRGAGVKTEREYYSYIVDTGEAGVVVGEPGYKLPKGGVSAADRGNFTGELFLHLTPKIGEHFNKLFGKMLQEDLFVPDAGFGRKRTEIPMVLAI